MNNKNIFTRSQIKFSLKNATEEFSLIRLRMTVGGIRFSYCLPADYKIKTDYWDKDAKRAIETAKQHKDLKGNPRLVVSLQNINREIEKTASALIDIIETYRSQNVTPTASVLQEELRKQLKYKDKQEDEKPFFPDFMSYIDYYIDLCKQGKILNIDSSTKISDGTLATYQSTKNILKKYAAARNVVLSFDSITSEFRKDFINFLYETKHKKGEYKANSIGKFIKIIKVIMGHALENNFTNNKSSLKRDFRVLREEANTIYLTDQELDDLYALELPPNQAEVRDCFLIACDTGLRYSDISALSGRHINMETKKITLITYKTNTKVIIPMRKRVREILKKYNWRPPHTQCNQATNRMLKKLCEQAGITESITYTEMAGGIRKERIFRKFEKVTTHTARRSFATNAFKLKLPTLSIMAMTGHKTETSFMKYIRISKEENAQLIQDHKFFE